MGRKSTFTPEEDAAARRMITEERPAKAIAEALGKPLSSIYSRARQTWKVALPSGRQDRSDEILAAMGAEPGTSAERIAERLNCSPVTVRRVVRERLGPGTFARAYRWSPEETRVLAALAGAGKNAAEIAEEMGATERAVKAKARQMGMALARKPGTGHGTSEGAEKRWADPSRRKVFAEKMRAYWTKPENRKLQSARTARQHEDPRYREAMRRVQREGSSCERTLWGILAGMGVEEGKDWERHFDVGPYQFDVLLRRPGQRDVLVEVNGDYWHTAVARVVRVDQSKRTYIERYHAAAYEVRTLWEHEFLAVNRIADTVRRWLGKEETRDFALDAVDVREAPLDAAREFLGRYHYTGAVGRWGTAFGASLGDELLAVAVFSHVVRQNIAPRWGLADPQVRELSRLAIKSDRHMRNFASWFLARAVRLAFERLPEVRLLLSYADETYGHSGGVYRAANWMEDGEVPADYWYVDADGFVTGKRALYRHASRMGLTEAAFAADRGLVKVYGGKKLRFVLHRP